MCAEDSAPNSVYCSLLPGPCGGSPESVHGEGWAEMRRMRVVPPHLHQKGDIASPTLSVAVSAFAEMENIGHM